MSVGGRLRGVLGDWEQLSLRVWLVPNGVQHLALRVTIQGTKMMSSVPTGFGT